MKWENDTRQYSSGKILFLGKWKVGGVYYDSCRPKDYPLRYGTECFLPGIKANLGNYETETEAQELVRTVVNYWINQCGQKYLKGEKNEI